MRILSFAWFAAIIVACGGTTTDIDGGADAAADATKSDSSTEAGADGSASDATADVVGVDAAACTPPDTTCATPCPSGTYCLKASGPQEHDLGCTPIPAACNGTATCDCMKDCFCAGNAIDTCTAGSDYLICNNGTISRRAFKKDIDYVTENEREDLARQTLEVPLARYRYKTEPESQQRHLGFIIDDQPPSSPAVASDGTHVDLYGYTSMLLATVQEQQKQIDALRTQVDDLRGACR
ncbi:MAG TPA: hypothetical protein VGH28_02605 [Polyangiaceae bacterium]|jgi:hypothetical protein